MKKMINNIAMKNILEYLPTGVLVYKMDTTLKYINQCALNILELKKENILGQKVQKKDWNLLNEFGRPLEFNEFPLIKVINTKKNINGMIVGLTNSSNTKTKWVLLNANIDDSLENQVILSFIDISLNQSISFKEVVDKATDAVVITKAQPLDLPDGPMIEYVNQAFCDISGYEKEELVGNHPRILQKEDISKESLSKIKMALIQKVPVRETLKNYTKKGEGYWIDISIFPLHGYENKITHFAAIERDITKIKDSELSHKIEARTDLLTGLLNRRGFDIYVAKSFNKLIIHEYSIIIIDIDHFKNVNDKFGHNFGDTVLKKIANIIIKECRKDDISSRMGGEEFIIFLPNVTREEALKIASRLRIKVESRKFTQNSIKFNITISLGISEGKKKSHLKKTIEKADIALYKSKEEGRNRINHSNNDLP